jgi:uncharacterized sulfatase
MYNRPLQLAVLLVAFALAGCGDIPDPGAPNFLFIISDDQSWAHTSRAGFKQVQTPNFDRIANAGLYFRNAFVSAPSCTASRSAILAGQDFWRLGSAGVLWGTYTGSMLSYQDLLRDAGYVVGYTGKGWSPGLIEGGAQPTGKSYNSVKRTAPTRGQQDLPANFEQFLDEKPAHRPFSFWVGSHEPHRPYEDHVADRFTAGSAASAVPPFLPATPTVTGNLSAYLDEIEYFDRDVGAIVQILKDRGLFDNTIVVVTSDNGMPFSRAKSTLYRYGVQVPLAIYWGKLAAPARTVDDFVTLTDIAPTFLEAAGVDIPEVMTGRSLLPVFFSDRGGLVDPVRDAAYVGFERHSDARPGNTTYSSRAIYTRDFAYIRNRFPQRWPAGDPPAFKDAIPWLLRAHPGGPYVEPYFSLAVAKRPAEELYNLRSDPFQLDNVAAEPGYATALDDLRRRLSAYLERTRDPVQLTGEDVFSGYEYHGTRE